MLWTVDFGEKKKFESFFEIEKKTLKNFKKLKKTTHEFDIKILLNNLCQYSGF